jgi:hypothetical protein
MKKLLTLTLVICAMITMALMTACQTTTTTQTAPGPSQKEALLAQSGFKVKTVTTQKQQQHVNQLPAGKVSAVKYNGKTYYAYPTANKDKVYVGTQAHYNAYQKAGQQQMAGDVDFATRTVGPHRVEIEQFDSFGPMGVESLGNW